MDLSIADEAQGSLYRECIGKQLEELGMLSSIYCNPGEMHVYDPGVISDFSEMLAGKTSILLAHLDFAITIATSTGHKIEVRVELPHLYPSIENANVTIHSALLSKLQHTMVKAEIENYIGTMDKSDIYIFQVISWIQEEIDTFLTKKTGNLTGRRADKGNPLAIVEFERLWIYSHHLKCRVKRQDIVRLSRELNLSGFSRPGKPGIVCVEGLRMNTNEFWRAIKSMHWQKIMIRKSEVKETPLNKLDTRRRFDGFREELLSESTDEENARICMKSFMAYLEKHKSAYIKKDLFGFE